MSRSLLPPLQGHVEQNRTKLSPAITAEHACGVDTVVFQPLTDEVEDRHFVADWSFSTGKWKFLAIFDGIEAVDFVKERLPASIKMAISSELLDKDRLPDTVIAKLLQDCITQVDETIRVDVERFFPGGEQEIAQLSDDEIRRVIQDPDEPSRSSVKILRARTGTTALIALVDPLKAIHIANLGDCQALICQPKPSEEGWGVRLLTHVHNCGNENEVERVKQQHANEEECVCNHRTLGLITLTRALGDMVFKLPYVYTERVFALAEPPFHPNYRFWDLANRLKTPPYLSTTADVVHIRPSFTNARLILSSDGLTDIFSRTHKAEHITEAISLWLNKGKEERAGWDEHGRNAAVELLFHALDGTKEDAIFSQFFVRSGRRVDDTTVLVLPFDKL
ncbi:hypothetical protein E1B28_000567 [Marasmius oreades]|uniref:PPM-type phosphatase domain-containing protein n=1 Tax=Marasmius oreades TaxID=181124 RepID=A0A9P8AEA0_9AGAR|nr:uncharacterized protein E1B28_000567 [Marasmius oreades]KAG7098651.1 hypothetical protein E1B28_000567 [Marasmius oreades]